MPFYEYRCEQGHVFEVRQRMTDDPLTECTTCEAPVQRVFHPVAIHFKGSGFHNTDYGKGRRGRGSEGDGEGGGKADGASSDGDSSSGDSAGGDGKGKAANDSKGSGDAGAKSSP